MYTLGTPTGHVRQYLQWIFSETGQQLLAKCGYVPVPTERRPKWEP
jgi:ABC-type phosphate transport system substrate-binding protein